MLNEANLSTLPQELIDLILSKFCDSRSLAYALPIFSTSRTHLSICLMIKKTLRRKRNEIFEGVQQDLMPQTRKLIKELEQRENDDVSTISKKLLILSFFENKSWQITTDVGIEIPQWSTTIQIQRMPIPEIRLIFYSSLASWTIKYAREWRYLTKNSRNLSFYPIPRRACPLPPIARIVAVNPTDVKYLSMIARSLESRNEVLCHHESRNSEAKMKVVIMTRKQALYRIAHVFNVESQMGKMSALRYEYNTSNKNAKKIQHGCNSIHNAVDELFAFMDTSFCNDLYPSSLSESVQELSALMNEAGIFLA